MKTLKKTLMTGCMALALVCMAAPLGHTQEVTPAKSICAKCGVVTPIYQCPQGSPNSVCVDINGNGRAKGFIFPATPSKKLWTLEDHYLQDLGTVSAYGQCPSWSTDGVCVVGGEDTICPKCGAAFHIDAGIKSLERQP